MGRQTAVVLYVLAIVAVVVGVDVLFFRHHFWERLIVNVGIVLVFAAFGLRFLKRPRAPSSLDAAGCVACQQATHLGQADQIEVTWDRVLERRGRHREVQSLVVPHPRGQTVDQPSRERVAGADPVHDMGQVVSGADEELPPIG